MSENIIRLAAANPSPRLRPEEIRLLALFDLSLTVEDARTSLERIARLEEMQECILAAINHENYGRTLAERGLHE